MRELERETLLRAGLLADADLQVVSELAQRRRGQVQETAQAA